MQDQTQSASWHEATLRDLSTTLQSLTASLNANGITPEVRQAAPYDLHQIDAHLGHQTLDDVLVASEALATLTGPSALADGEMQRIHTLARTLATTWEALQSGAGQTVLMEVVATQPMALGAVLNVQRVQNEIAHIVELLHALAGEPTAAMGAVVPARRRLGVPAFLLAVLFALFLFIG